MMTHDVCGEGDLNVITGQIVEVSESFEWLCEAVYMERRGWEDAEMSCLTSSDVSWSRGWKVSGQ